MFKYIKYAILVYVLTYLNHTAEAQLQPERYFNNTGGLIDRYSPVLVPAKNASDIQNIQFDTRGKLLKRNGFDLNNSTSVTTGGTAYMSTRAVAGLGYHQSTTGTSFLGIVVGTNVFTSGNSYGGTFTNVTGTITITTGQTNQAQFTSFRDYGIMCTNSDPPIRILNASAFRIVGASTGAKTCESFNNYLLLGHTSEDAVIYGSRLRWSDLNSITSWPANNYIDIEPDDGDSITAIKRYQNTLYVFKKRSIHEVIITGNSGADAFIVRPVARGIGAYAKNSVVPIETRGIVFLGADGIYLFDGSNFEFISDPIQTKINNLNRSRYPYAVGALYPAKHQLWLAVSAGSETSNDTILVWDYIQEAWSVYDGITANALTTVEDSNGNILLFSGDNTGNLYKQDTGTSDEPAGVTTAISSFYTTPDLTIGMPETDKSFKYLYVFTSITNTTNITVDVSYNYAAGFQDSHLLSVGQTGAAWGTATWGTSLWPSAGTNISRITLDRRAKSVRIKFSDNSATNLGILGWTLVYTPEDYRVDSH